MGDKVYITYHIRAYDVELSLFPISPLTKSLF